MQEWVAMVGSLREASYNRALFQVFRELAPNAVTWTEASIGSLPFYNPEMEPPFQATQFWEVMRRADALVFFTPEYNGSIPAVVKNALDWASRDPAGSSIAGKPAVVLGASQGLFGTLRSQLHLREILTFMDADLVQKPEVLIAEAHLKLKPQGHLNDTVAKRLMTMLAETLYARVGTRISV